MDYEALASEIEERAAGLDDESAPGGTDRRMHRKGFAKGMRHAAQIVREAGDAKVPDVGAHRAALVGLRVELVQKIDQLLKWIPEGGR